MVVSMRGSGGQQSPSVSRSSDGKVVGGNNRCNRGGYASLLGVRYLQLNISRRRKRNEE